MISILGEQIHWTQIKDGNPRARQLADRHYSRKTKGGKWFVGIGQKIVLMTPEGGALFIWRKSDDKLRMDTQTGIECTLFRNERPDLYLSSDLIKEAVDIAYRRWGKVRVFSYINPSKIKSTYPGFCFIKAGWKKAGKNKSGKLRIVALDP